MGRRELWVGVLAVVGSGMVGLACPSQNDTTGTNGPGCLVDVPCEDDPAKTCQENVCNNQGGPGLGQTGSTGTGGSGGSSGSGGGSVEVTGNIVEITTTAFDASVPYTGAIKVIAAGATTATVESDAVDGSFALADAASGTQWVLAQDASGGMGGVFSTYSVQVLDGATPVVLPAVAVDVMESVGTQVGVGSLLAGSAHLVLEVADENGLLLDGVELQELSGATVVYDVAPGQYAVGVGGTGAQGLALALNVDLPAMGTVMVSMTYNGDSYLVPLAMAPDTVTYRLVTLDMTP